MATKKTVKKNQIVQAVENYNSPDQLIATAKKSFMKLKLVDKDDIKNYDLVKSALSEVVSLRTSTDSKRKELKRIVDAESKRLLALIQPIESHLKEQKEIRDIYIAAEKKRKEDEEKAELAQKLADQEAENQALLKKLQDAQALNNEIGDLFGHETPSEPVGIVPENSYVNDDHVEKNSDFIKASPNTEMLINQYSTLQSIVDQFERCNYVDNGHPLVNNIAFIALKRMASKEQSNNI